MTLTASHLQCKDHDFENETNHVLKKQLHSGDQSGEYQVRYEQIFFL